MSEAPRPRWRDAALLSLVFWSAALLLRPLQDIPLNDDWVFAAAVRALVGGGRLALPAMATPNLLVQALWGAAFSWALGPGHGALRLSTLVLGWIGVSAFYWASGDVWLSLLLAFNPLFLALCPSFMTDVPAFSLCLVGLALLRRALEKEDGRAWAAGASAFFALAYGVRQTALLAPLGVSIYALMTGRPRRRELALVWALPAAAFLGQALWRLRSGAAADYYPWIWDDPSLPPAASLALPALRLHAALLYCGLFVSPLAAVFWCERPLERLKSLSRRRAVAAAAFAAAAALLMAAGSRLPYRFQSGHWQLDRLFYSCSYLNDWGLGCANVHGLAARPGFLVYARWFWPAVNAVAWLSVATVAAALLASPRPPLAGLALAVFLPQFAATLPASRFFDRYFLPLAPVALLLAAPAAARRRGPLLAAVAMFALLSWAAVADYLGTMRAAWSLGERAVALGYAPTRVYASLDWCRAHDEDEEFARLSRAAAFARSDVETTTPCMTDPDAVVTFKAPPRPLGELLASGRFFSPLAGREQSLYLYRRKK